MVRSVTSKEDERKKSKMGKRKKTKRWGKSEYFGIEKKRDGRN